MLIVICVLFCVVFVGLNFICVENFLNVFLVGMFICFDMVDILFFVRLMLVCVVFDVISVVVVNVVSMEWEKDIFMGFFIW